MSTVLWNYKTHVNREISAGAENFSLRHRVNTICEAHSASCPMGMGFFPRGVKLPVREAYHSPPSSQG